MAGISLRLDGTSPTLAILQGIDGRLTHARPMYDEIGGHLEFSTSRRFDNERGPDGKSWPKSLRALATGGSTLKYSGDLLRQMQRIATDTSVEFGNNKEYAAIHQYGGTIRAKTSKGLRWKYSKAGANKASWARKMQVTLPARPYIGLDDQDETAIVAIVERYLEADHAR